MDFKAIQKQLKTLRDRIRADGSISASTEQALRSILESTQDSAHSEAHTLQERLNAHMAAQAGNDNNKPSLSEEQQRRLSIIEKTGTGSYAVH